MGHRTGFLSILAALLLGACSEQSTMDPDYVAATETWRSEREARLTAPHGWLSLAGLHPLATGTMTIGTETEAAIRLPAGPSLWGVLEFDGETLLLTRSDDRVAVDGGDAEPPELAWRSGAQGAELSADDILVQVIDRGDRPHLRVRDPNAPSRRDFVGLTWFDVDPSWAIDASFEPHPEGTTLRIADVTGNVSAQPNPGAVSFRRDGETHRLQAVQSSPDARMWFIFSDGTSGRESYGLGRFLYFDPPENGQVRLDFNQAYNPPCAFNPHTTCPLPPPDNRLTLPIRAGEMSYTGPVGLQPESVTLED